MSKIIFISDIHLGVEHDHAYPRRQERLLEKLAQWREESITHLILLGDIYEFWMEYRDFIPKADFDFLKELREMVLSGVEVHYFSGNHDFNLGTFFSDQLGIYVHHDMQVLELQGHRTLLLHGDGMAASDSKYRLAKKVITHPLSNFLFKLLHPDWGMALARWVGSTSRSHHEYGPVKWDEYQSAALDLMAQTQSDVCINGHIHVDRHQVLQAEDGTEKLYLNIGQWFHDPSWIELEQGIFSVKKLRDEDELNSPQ